MHSKASSFLFLIVALLFLQLGCGLRPPDSQLQERLPVVSLLVVSGQAVNQVVGGEVQISRQGYPFSPVSVGLPLQRGDQIETSENGEVIIDLEPGVRAYVGTDTRVTLSSLKVEWGKVWVSIQGFFFQAKGHFDLETQNASAILVGTNIYVRVGDTQTSYIMLEGKALLEPKAPATWRSLYLGQGEQVILAPGRAPRGPFPAKPQELDSLRQWKDRLEQMQRSAGAQTPQVPSVIGMNQDGAEAILRRAGLRIGRIQSRATGTKEPGTVVDQRPTAGAVVRLDTPVHLVVEAYRPPPTQVPPVIGMIPEQAAAVLQDAGLQVGGVHESITRRVPPGLIADQNPPAGAIVEWNTLVFLVVEARRSPTTSVPPPPTVQVPQVIGMREGDAGPTLARAGLRVGKVDRIHTGEFAPGKVRAQQPMPGALVPPNTVVNLVVEIPSIGPRPSRPPDRPGGLQVPPQPTPVPPPRPPQPPPSRPPDRPGGLQAPVEVPSVIRMPEKDAVSTLVRHGLQKGQVTYKRTDEVASGQVSQQQPTAGALVPRNTAVNLVIEVFIVE